MILSLALLAACTGPDTDGDTGPEVTVADLDPWVAPSVLWVEPMDPAPGTEAEVHYCGPLARLEGVQIHYGFDGWGQVSGVDLVEVASGPDRSWFADAPMAPDGTGCQVTTVPLPTDGAAMHMVFHAGDEWDSRDRLDYHWSLEFPYAGPYLTPQGPSTLVVHWETSVPCLGVVEHGPTPELGHLVAGHEAGHLHHVTVEDLRPGPWFYRVHDSAGHATEIFEVQLVDPDAEAMRLVAASDAQDGGEEQRWDATARAILAAEPELLLFPGDLAADDGPGHWWIFFHVGRELLARVPMAAVPGNHDTPSPDPNPDTSSFERWFDRTPPHTSVDYGPVHLLLLSSEDLAAFAEDGEQVAFAASDIATASADWVLAAWHIPPYNAGSRHLEEQLVTRAVTESFHGRVDWVFAGHEHLAQRFLPLGPDGEVAGSYGRGPDQGVGYTVLPPAGQWTASTIVSEASEHAAMRDLLTFPVVIPGSDQVPSELGFVTVDLDPGSMTLETWGMGTLEAPEALHRRDIATVTR